MGCCCSKSAAQRLVDQEEADRGQLTASTDSAKAAEMQTLPVANNSLYPPDSSPPPVTLRRERPIPVVSVRIPAGCVFNERLDAEHTGVDSALDYMYGWQRSVHITTGWKNVSEDTFFPSPFVPTIEDVNHYVRSRVRCVKSDQVAMSNPCWIGMTTRLASAVVAQIVPGEARFTFILADGSTGAPGGPKPHVSVLLTHERLKIKRLKGAPASPPVGKSLYHTLWTEPALRPAVIPNRDDTRAVVLHINDAVIPLVALSEDDKILFVLVFRCFVALGTPAVAQDCVGPDVAAKWRKYDKKSAASLKASLTTAPAGAVVADESLADNLVAARDVLLAVLQTDVSPPV